MNAICQMYYVIYLSINQMFSYQLLPSRPHLSRKRTLQLYCIEIQRGKEIVYLCYNAMKQTFVQCKPKKIRKVSLRCQLPSDSLRSHFYGIKVERHWDIVQNSIALPKESCKKTLSLFINSTSNCLIYFVYRISKCAALCESLLSPCLDGDGCRSIW